MFIVITDRRRLRPVRVGVEIASALSRMYPGTYRVNEAARLFGSATGLTRIAAGEDAGTIATSWAAGEARWRLLRAKYLRY